jgi:hypothetical protein
LRALEGFRNLSSRRMRSAEHNRALFDSGSAYFLPSSYVRLQLRWPVRLHIRSPPA